MSSESAPSRKRARADSAGDPEATSNLNLRTSNLRKDSEVWFSDGSIVIATADNVAFRVHKSILSRRSEVFGDLFSLSNADKATSETIEACPVVRVSDSSADIRHLLLVLCCGKNYYHDGDALIAAPFEVLASLIRMAHKYAVQDVLDHALSRLKKYYTNDFSAWQDPSTRARYVATANHHAPTVVKLARLTNTPSLLPTALLLCTELLTRASVRGSLVPVPAAPALCISSLPIPDQLLLLSSRARLVRRCAERPLRLLAAVPCADCQCTGTMRRGLCAIARVAPLLGTCDGPRHAFLNPLLHCEGTS